MKKLLFFCLVLFNNNAAPCQQVDSLGLFKNNSSVNVNDSSIKNDSGLAIKHKTYDSTLADLLQLNQHINYSNAAVPVLNLEKSDTGKEGLFYLLAVDILLLGFFKLFYTKYFNNIFRVFFNTSLRQNQLTDILLQARLPSLIFNLFFIVNAGIYFWLILNRYSLHIPGYNNIMFPLFCIGFLGIIYGGKFLILKIIGWLTGMNDAADTYIFITFLINKIIGIMLVPFIILLAFGPLSWQLGITLLSVALILLLFLMRFYRSYGLLEHQFTLNRFHFFIYVLALEIIPVLILYKMVSNSIQPG